jgi:hypothetical protein
MLLFAACGHFAPQNPKQPSEATSDFSAGFFSRARP